MKAYEVQYSDVNKIRLTITPNRITIKVPLYTSPRKIEQVKEFFNIVANKEEMKNCTKSFRGVLQEETNNRFLINLKSDSGKEEFCYQNF